MSKDKESREERLERVKQLLSQGELFAYEYWAKVNQPSLAASLNAQLFTLFLNGKTCEEIRRLNMALTLGQIVAARVEGDWDARRDEHLDRLLTETSKRAEQATLETVEFVCDMLAVASREHGEKFRRYLQTGSQADLGEFKIDSIFNLKQTIEILQKLTGADRVAKTEVKNTGEIVHRHEGQILPSKAPTSEEAANVLKNLKALLPKSN